MNKISTKPFFQTLSIILTCFLSSILSATANGSSTANSKVGPPVLVLNSLPVNYDYVSPFSVNYNNVNFLFSPSQNTTYVDLATDGSFTGLYASDYSVPSTSGTDLTISAPGYSFDLNSLRYFIDKRNSDIKITIKRIDGSTKTDVYLFNLTADQAGSLSSFSTAVNDVVSIRIVTDQYFTVNDFDITDIKPLTTLPVELNAFNVAANGNQVVLSWSTLSETNNNKFLIYRSGADKNFIKIGEKQGAVNSSSILNYSFYDSKPLFGDNYYKLVQEDKNGDQKEVAIKLFRFDLKITTVSVYPNPVINNVNVSFDANEKYSKFILCDLQGKKLQEGTIAANDSNISLSLSNYAKGVYFIKLHSVNGLTTKKISKL